MQEKRLLKKINLIEIYQVIGGILGLLFTLYLLFTTDLSKYQNINGYVAITTPFLFFGFCIYSGVLLNKKKYPQGLKFTIISLFLQLIAFQFFGLYYSVVNGIGIKVTLDLSKDIIAGFDFHPSHFLIVLNNDIEIFIVKINLVALGMLFYVSNIYNTLNK